MIELLIIALVFLVYFRTFSYSIVVDDVQWYQQIKNGVGQFESWKKILNSMRLKLYGGGTFGLDIKVDHIFTTSLHALTCVLIYLAFGQNPISFAAALLYAIHPANNQTSIWLNGRRYQISIILVLTMLYLSKTTPLAIVFYFLAMPLQVTAIFAPILLVKQPVFLLALPVALFCLFKFAILKERILWRARTIPDEDRKQFTAKRLIIIVKYYGHFFFKMLFPGTCVMVYKRLHYWGRTEEGNKDAYGFNLDFWKGILALVGSVLGICFLPFDLELMALFTTLATLQWCAIIPVIHDLADRYVSLPNVFMMFFVSYVAQTYLGVYAVPFLAALGGYYLSSLFNVMPMYKDYNKMWDYHRYFNPSTPSPRKQEIKWLLQRNDLTRAWVLTREGLQHTPNDFQLLYDAAVCHYRIGEFGLAKDFAKRAMDNYFLYTKKTAEPEMQAFIKHLDAYAAKNRPGSRIIPQQQPMNRNQRRAQERAKVAV